jgi:hypothetical protein
VSWRRQPLDVQDRPSLGDPEFFIPLIFFVADILKSPIILKLILKIPLVRSAGTARGLSQVASAAWIEIRQRWPQLSFFTMIHIGTSKEIIQSTTVRSRQTTTPEPGIIIIAGYPLLLEVLKTLDLMEPYTAEIRVPASATPILL